MRRLRLCSVPKRRRYISPPAGRKATIGRSWGPSIRLRDATSVTTAVEHEAVRNACKRLEAEGFSVSWLGVDEVGAIDLDELRSLLTERDRGGFDHARE